jgi:peptidoglycan/LPS O-acetylase OafA/YrhL
MRAIAIFMVFTWHFIQVINQQKAPPPVFPLSLLTEGHTGVALFMVLSGYLFAKLLDGKNIVYPSFIWNRFLRLVPLLLVVIIIVGFQRYLAGQDLLNYAIRIVAGIIFPSLPNGGWSITVEFHFYLMLPVLLFLTKKWKYSLLFVLLIALIVRTLLYLEFGQIVNLSYFTIVGRIDQFLLGIFAYKIRQSISGRHVLVLSSIAMFAMFYWYFDSQGGISYKSPSSIWIIMPTIEGLTYALTIAWYDSSFIHSTGKLSKFIALFGTYSYSIYLLHFFVVFRLSNAIHNHIIDLSNIHTALLFSILGFLLMVPIGYVSYRYIESPFLRYRTKYIVAEKIKAIHSIEIQTSSKK